MITFFCLFVYVVLLLRIVNFCSFQVALFDCFSLFIKVRTKLSPVAGVPNQAVVGARVAERERERESRETKNKQTH